MLVTVFCAPRERPETTFALDVSPELELRDFVALCEVESGIPAGEIEVSYVDQLLKDPTRAMGTYGLKDGDVVVLRQADRRPPQTQSAFPGLPRIDFSSIAVPGTSSSTSQRPATRPQPSQAPQPQVEQQRSPPPPAPLTLRGSGAASTSGSGSGSGSSPQGMDDPALLQQMLLANPHELSLLKERNPPLAEALLSGDLERFTKVLLEQQQDRARREQERIRLLTADPFDLDAQAKIEEDIRQHNVEENMTIAMEEAPESFGQVVMLYINCIVNGCPVKAFVDSGAQMTIMSQACAERCNIMRLVDRRWAGIAKGVGTQKIIGRVHLAQVQIEGDFLPCSFSILEDQPMDMLLGLDMLKRHQCSIDLKTSALLIATTGTITRFLPEAELPECARLAYGPEGREDAPADEIADRELAEALQRSVQESDTADRQTTSPKSPPFPFNQQLSPSSSPSTSQGLSSGRPQSLALDRSTSAPGAMRQAPTPGQCRGHPGFQGLPGPSSQAEDTTPVAPQVPPRILPSPNSSALSPSPLSKEPPAYTPATERAVIGSPTQGDPRGEALPAADMGDEPEGCPSADNLPVTYTQATEKAAAGHPEGKVPNVDMSGEAEGAVIGPLLPHSKEPVQPMEQEDDDGTTGAQHARQKDPGLQSQDHHPLQHAATNPLSLDLGSCPADHAPPGDAIVEPEPCSAEMESPTEVQSSAVSSERDQPEGERCSRTNSIPSLAAALLELHALLVSNSRALSQDRSASCSPHPFRQDADGLDGNPGPEPTAMPENTPPAPSTTAITVCAQPSDATANLPVVLAKGPSECVPPGPSGPELRQQAEATEGREPQPQCPGVSAPTEDLEFREPPEGQQGRGIADGRASGTGTPDTLGLRPQAPLQSPLSLAVGSPVEDSGISLPALPPLAQAPRPTASSPAPSPSAPHPFTEQFPAEHVRRIQASGFSAREAAEALEQAHGIVELALLALLARSITVPS